jgi:hypothetical protein
MVPSMDEPPAVPLTAQVTAVLELPETVPVNWNVSPARMFAVEGETLTETEAGVAGLVGLFDVEEVPAQPQVSRTASMGMAVAAERMALRTHLELATL